MWTIVKESRMWQWCSPIKCIDVLLPSEKHAYMYIISQLAASVCVLQVICKLQWCEAFKVPIKV